MRRKGVAHSRREIFVAGHAAQAGDVDMGRVKIATEVDHNIAQERCCPRVMDEARLYGAEDLDEFFN